MNQTTPENENFRRRVPKSFPVSRVLLIGVILLLAAALIITSVSAYKTNQKVEDWEATASSLASENEMLSQSVSQAQSDLAGLQEKEEKTQSDSKAKDKQINALESQVKDLTSRLNDVVSTSTKKNDGKNKTGQTLYATVAVSEKTCYLTFDDGPSDNTLKILDILDQYNVKATFFVVGNSGKLSYVKKIHEAGHAIALHSDTHDYAKIYASQKAYFADLEKLAGKIEKQIGVSPKVMRFPGGSSNTISRDYCKGIMTALSKETLNRGYVYFDWNVDSTDASGNKVPASKIIKNIKTYGGKNKQDVVLMHDTASKTTTVEALPKIIEFYIQKGYTFAPLTTSTPQVKHSVNN